MSVLAWIALVLLAWVGLALGFALVIGRGIATADEAASEEQVPPVRLPDDRMWI